MEKKEGKAARSENAFGPDWKQRMSANRISATLRMSSFG